MVHVISALADSEVVMDDDGSFEVIISHDKPPPLTARIGWQLKGSKMVSLYSGGMGSLPEW